MDKYSHRAAGRGSFVDPPFLRLLRSDARLQVLQRNLDLNSVGEWNWA